LLRTERAAYADRQTGLTIQFLRACLVKCIFGSSQGTCLDRCVGALLGLSGR